MIINNWYRPTQKCFNDFSKFTYSCNSPDLLLNTIVKLPRSNHLPFKQFINLNTPLCNAEMYYHKIEEGFWILTTQIDVKENIVISSDYDKNLSAHYYLLSFSTFENKFIFKDTEDVKFTSSSWTFSKPRTEFTTSFHKNTLGSLFTIAIHKKWMHEKFLSKSFSQQDGIEKLLNDKKGFFSGLNITTEARSLITKINQILRTESSKHPSETELTVNCTELTFDFFNKSFEYQRIKNNISLKNADYHNTCKAEKIILDNLCHPFIGIEFIAREVNISPSKLKLNFKEVYGVSMLKYYKEKNMLLAMQLIQNSDMPIKNIAEITGYSDGSANKFTANFKKRFGNLPKNIRKFNHSVNI